MKGRIKCNDSQQKAVCIWWPTKGQCNRLQKSHHVLYPEEEGVKECLEDGVERSYRENRRWQVERTRRRRIPLRHRQRDWRWENKFPDNEQKEEGRTETDFQVEHTHTFHDCYAKVDLRKFMCLLNHESQKEVKIHEFICSWRRGAAKYMYDWFSFILTFFLFFCPVHVSSSSSCCLC